MSEITLPRKKHSRQGVYCYKTQCQQPQRIEACANSQWQAKHEAERLAATR